MRPSHLIGTALLSFIAIPALADPPPGLPSRTQNGNVVMSSANPHLNISVSRSFTALPPLAFDADGRWIDRRLFVDARDGKVRRLIVIDFDQGGPGDQAAGTMRRWGHDAYDSTAFRIDLTKEGSDAAVARTLAFLKSKGYEAGQALLALRLSRKTSDDGRSRLVVLYGEAVADAPAAGAPGDADADALFARFQKLTAASHE